MSLHRVVLAATFALVTAFALVTGFAAQAADPFLADRHIAKGSQCVSCHETATPSAGDYVESDKCLACHGDRKSLAAKFTPMGKRNPHDNHQGDLDCTLCHFGHKPPVAYCSNCHRDFTLEMR